MVSGELRMNLVTVVFSKDRAMQLDATLRSFDYHVHGRPGKVVLFTTSSDFHADQYARLMEDHPGWAFVREQDFKRQLLMIVENADHILFVVDDCLFFGDFRLERLTKALDEHEQAIGVSLRLGKNTTYCYVVDSPDNVPSMRPIDLDGLSAYRWSEHSGGAFDYPLEVSSSLYRSADIMPLLVAEEYSSPNTLEAALAARTNSFWSKPDLICFEQSVAFCAPINKVQNLYDNRAGTQAAYSTEALAEKYNAGQRIDLSILEDFIPKGCHEEIDLQFIQVRGEVPHTSAHEEPAP
jgi:hypothetical protein